MLSRVQYKTHLDLLSNERLCSAGHLGGKEWERGKWVSGQVKVKSGRHLRVFSKSHVDRWFFAVICLLEHKRVGRLLNLHCFLRSQAHVKLSSVTGF